MIYCIFNVTMPFALTMSRDSSPVHLDRLAIGLSALCVVHCLFSVLLVVLLSGASSLVADPIVHRIGLGVAAVLAAVALRRGYAAHRARLPAAIGVTGIAIMALALLVPHGWAEVAMTVTGVVILALAHLMNTRTHA